MNESLHRTVKSLRLRERRVNYNEGERNLIVIPPPIPPIEEIEPKIRSRRGRGRNKKKNGLKTKKNEV